ncbi:dihydrolipoamide acetyltransferase family protein [Longimicrobium sp.]|uniref:dihydrolipoamide acetyltransferase family protein n=1 Tax=Longimicrobium sp. TaxID=2029185 RepID=UPI002E341718|nr:dihydrolipoamide acetyltransferase family protein [Longimicrobium sp.]HEX6039856.1 dihydrolipoamide acetyltransferase family protein [Longimicrobium sp.]
MARVEVPMPQMGESIAEGTVSVWLKKVGDRVERDEPIMEISTDKVDAEIPAPVAGVIAEVVVSEGQTVEVGTVVAYIETEAGAAASPAPAAPSTPAAGSTDHIQVPGERETSMPESAVGQAEKGGGTPADGRGAQEPMGTAAGGTAQGAPAPSDGPASLEERLRTRSTPLVRKIAAEHNVEVHQVPGTGRNGRVTKDDILKFVEEGQKAPAAQPATAAAPAQQPPAQRPAAPAPASYEGGFPWDEFYGAPQHPTVNAGPNDRVEPASRMTQIIANNMVQSRRISPHVHSYFEVDYTRLDQVRGKNKKVWADQGVKVTYTHFIAWAVARALREFPKINASYSNHEIIYRADVNLGIAVALDHGLIVPVIKQADELSLVGLAKRLNDIATRARNKQLKPDEIQGGTFTITNPGIFGTTIGFPIINQPQVAILGVGGVEMRPAVISDEYGNHAIVPRKRGFISLGYDHRLVNGADGDQFLARVKQLMETFPDQA